MIINSDNYVENVLRTESIDYDKIAERLSDPKIVRLLHAALGKATEIGEFIDPLKKYIFYGKEIDEVNMLEEIGDGKWYDGVAIDALDSTEEIVMSRNIQKLAKRYPDKFTEDAALNRDLEAEREILEGIKPEVTE